MFLSDNLRLKETAVSLSPCQSLGPPLYSSEAYACVPVTAELGRPHGMACWTSRTSSFGSVRHLYQRSIIVHELECNVCRQAMTG